MAMMVLSASLLGACRDRAAPELPPAEIQPAATIELDSTRVIEVLGLRRWTAEMLRDSLAKATPGEGLDSPEAAVNLRNALGFADAAAFTSSVVFDDNDRTIITIAVREPSDSAMVRYAPQALDTVAVIEEWKPITAVFQSDSGVPLLFNVASAHLDGPQRVVVDSTVRGRRITHTEGFAFESAADSLAAQPILARLARLTTEADFATAIRTIDASQSLPDRIVAVLVLANFPTRDLAWRKLLRASVGREQALDASIAAHALTGLSSRAPKGVDWTSEAATIRDVLHGTALFALPAVATALTRTGASPASAGAWLGGGGEMLTAFLESENPELRGPAHRLLVTLRGEDLGTDPAAWRQWIATLPAPAVIPDSGK